MFLSKVEEEGGADGITVRLLATKSVLEASVVVWWGSVVHGQVHVVVMRVEGRVVVVLVVVVIVQGGQVLKWGHVRRWGQLGYDDLAVDRALRRSWLEAGAWGDKQRRLYRLGVWSGLGVRIGWVLWRRTHPRPLGVCDGLRGWADPLP